MVCGLFTASGKKSSHKVTMGGKKFSHKVASDTYSGSGEGWSLWDWG